ncbi:hypothetical protein [Amycolatopsis dendrobii]|uniref:Uncharacterized protein n=1 Tax=Amycolatopsis dendrobii TaxID=2760662 RepID=A0A7W3VUK2_9PSEU|nr:hypothetical protein [Amycolatopsis dendrobii]MBB1153486.1 hypothetical protein [Amycolatopsis dendrobii]
MTDEANRARDFLLLMNLKASGNLRHTAGRWEYLGHHYPRGQRTRAWLLANPTAAAGYERLLKAGLIAVDPAGNAEFVG